MTQARNLSRLLNKKLETFKFTATAGQTTFSDSDDAGNILSYTPENMLVTYNGVVLESGSEYTATNGTSVVLDTGADSAAEVNIYAFESVSLGGYVPVTGGTFGGALGIGSGASNRLAFDYNPISGVATVGPNSTGGSTSLELGTSNSGSYSSKMHITNTGSIGIGIASPSFATIDTYTQRGIHISGVKESGTAPVIRLTENGSGRGAFEIRSNREGTTSGNFLAFGENSDTFMVLRGDDNGGGTATRGNAGIGTTSPAGKLHVDTASSTNRALIVESSTGWGNINVPMVEISTNSDGKVFKATANTNRSDMNMFEIANANGNVLAIRGTGAVTLPYQPAFDVASTTGVTNAVQTFNTVYLNRGSHFSTGTSRFTAPVAGVYYFNATTIKAGGDTTAVTRVYLRINGSITYGSRHVRMSEGSSYGTNGVGSWTVNLSVNDYVEVYVGQYGSHASTEYTYFNGHLLG